MNWHRRHMIKCRIKQTNDKEGTNVNICSNLNVKNRVTQKKKYTCKIIFVKIINEVCKILFRSYISSFGCLFYQHECTMEPSYSYLFYHIYFKNIIEWRHRISSGCLNHLFYLHQLFLLFFRDLGFTTGYLSPDLFYSITSGFCTHGHLPRPVKSSPKPPSTHMIFSR